MVLITSTNTCRSLLVYEYTFSTKLRDHFSNEYFCFFSAPEALCEKHFILLFLFKAFNIKVLIYIILPIDDIIQDFFIKKVEWNGEMKNKKKAVFLLGLMILCGIIYFGFLHFKIRENIVNGATSQADYLIILGARVKGNVPSLALQYRIDTAAKYLKENPRTIAIASGGQGPGEDITEAEAIKKGLIKQKIESERIILEDKSTNTVENINFSKKLIPKSSDIGILVTNDFHIYRAKMIARDQGLDIEGLPARTPVVALIKSYSREYLAITKYYLFK